MNQYYLSVFPGLASVAADELQVKLALKPSASERLRNNELLRVTTTDPRKLLDLYTVEDVYAHVARLKLSGQLSDMKALAAGGLWQAPLRQALVAWSVVNGRPLTKRMVFRVVVQADDERWRQYRRQEMMLAAERGLLQAGSSWRLDRDTAPLEIWLQQIGRELLVSVRLTTPDHRARGGRVSERAAALRPTVAAAMVWLTQPRPDDVFLDPMCGSGTILLERAVAERYGMLLGGDNEAAAVAATLANFGPRHQPREIKRWDARELPLKAASVSAVACNLPWGRQIGEHADLPALYHEALRELVRVTQTGGRIVLLTSEWKLLKDIIAQTAGLRLAKTVSNVEILGRRADLFVLART